jgi:predicted amidophosphoribosyltransferase
MPLNVTTFATYLTRPGWTDDDRNALKFIKAIKGKPFRYSAQVPVLGRIKLLEATNAQDAVDWFGELAAAEVAGLGLRGPLIFVPLPNSACTQADKNKPRTALLAEAVASKLNNAQVWDGLRWTTVMIPTHQGGTRDPQILYDNLTVTSKPPKGTVILVDDVFTQGGHLQAAAARLLETKAVCQLAVCAGRTVLQSQNDPFLISRDPLPDFTPVKK